MKYMIAALIFLSTNAAADYTFSGNNLLRYCEQGERILSAPDGVPSGANSREASMCLGFLEGARLGIVYGEHAAGENGPKLFCSPNGAPPSQFLRVTLQWMRNHPERLHEHGVVVVGSALSEAFPCQR